MDKRKIEQIRQKYDLIIQINEDADVEFWYAREQELIEERISLIERTEARGRLKESEKRLSRGYSTQEMKNKLGVQNNSTIRDMLGQRGIKPENYPNQIQTMKTNNFLSSNFFFLFIQVHIMEHVTSCLTILNTLKIPPYTHSAFCGFFIFQRKNQILECPISVFLEKRLLFIVEPIQHDGYSKGTSGETIESR